MTRQALIVINSLFSVQRTQKPESAEMKMVRQYMAGGERPPILCTQMRGSETRIGQRQNVINNLVFSQKTQKLSLLVCKWSGDS